MTPYYEKDGITIYHGDCLDVLPSVHAHVLLTDPDYGVGMMYGETTLSAPEADELLVSALSHAAIESGHGILFWSGSWKRVLALATLIKRTPWDVRHLGVWYKPNGAGPSGNGLARRFETWYWIDQGTGKRESEWRFLPDCIAANRVHRGMEEARSHPSQKPETLIGQLTRFISRPGDVVLDPFMGSGTTLRAAKDLGRRAIGIEIEEKYCEMAVRRLAQKVLPFPADKENP